jgi:lipoate-protein ligase A
MRSLLWLDLSPRDAATQMAIDTATVSVLAGTDTVLLRLYRWSTDTISLGANESALRHWDRAAIERDAVACVRRPTGGRAVWHGQSDLTYGWVGPVAGPAGVRDTYRTLHERLAAAMRHEHRAVALAPALGNPGLGPGACFDVPVGGEVLVDGRKAIGSAQRVYGSVLLQHGAIAVHERGPELTRYRLDRTRPASDGVAAPLADAEAIAASIAAHWIAAGAEPAEEELTSRIVLASVGQLAHYRDPAWTWRR